MESTISYVSRTSLPQFSDFDYKKEDPVILAVDSDYNPNEINQILREEEGAVLLQDLRKWRQLKL